MDGAISIFSASNKNLEPTGDPYFIKYSITASKSVHSESFFIII